MELVIVWEQVVTWRVTCRCGWVGEQLLADDNGRFNTRDCRVDVQDRVFAPA